MRIHCMEQRMKLGDYLVASLKKIGVSHLFGIPGDLIINLCRRFARGTGHRNRKVVRLSQNSKVSVA
jgi:thiamine pyrophosphate-dependent acetolactate synthase large subunit-like protein